MPLHVSLRQSFTDSPRAGGATSIVTNENRFPKYKAKTITGNELKVNLY